MSFSGNYRIAVSAGELSGDMHTAMVVQALRRFNPQAEVRGMGGGYLRGAGVNTVVDSERCAALQGLNIPWLVIRSLGAFLRMVKLLLFWRPHVLVVTDYPDFNLRLAKIAARFCGVPVLYYIPPKVWAWRSGRIKTMKKVIDRAALILPFEKSFYEQHGFEQTLFVGHPFAYTLDPAHLGDFSKDDFIKSLGLDPLKPVVALFPGSRSGEIKRHLKRVIAGLECLRTSRPNIQVIVAVAAGIKSNVISAEIGDREWIKVSNGNNLEIMRCATAGLLKSGTCNLEAAFLGLPFVCFYIPPRLTEKIVRALATIKFSSLVNLIKADAVVELIQDHASPSRIATELEKVMFDQECRRRVLADLKAVTAELSTHDQYPAFDGCKNAAERTAKLTLELAEKGGLRHNLKRSLKAFLKPYRYQFFGALGCMLLFGASDGLVPFLVKHVLDDVFKNHDRRMLVLLPIALMVFALTRAAVDFGQQFLMARIGHNIIRDLRNKLNQHLLTLSPGFFLRHSCGNLLSRFTSDVILVKDLLTNCIASVIRDSIRIVALLIAAFYLDPVLALIAFVVFPIGLIPVYNFGRRMRKLSKIGQESIGSLSELVQESILGSRVVKIFGRERFEQECFEEENHRLNKIFVKSERVRALTGPINEVLGSLAICGVLLYGGHSVINGLRSQGDFIAFLLSVFLLYDPFKKLSQVNNQVQQGLSGAERIFELLNVSPDIQDPPSPVPLGASNEIIFEDVSFTYKPGEPGALKNITLTVAEGSKVAIVGFSGAGKSTLIDIIPRFIDPQSGRVSIGGVDISRVRLSELRARIALVSQHTFLFNDTVYNNIAYGNEKASRKEVLSAAKSAYAYDFIMKLPQGFETVIGESGLTLSGGERQRIAIARAILKGAPILILDEATASLDNRSEREVQAAIEKLEENKTSLVIAHRLSTVREADLIVVLEEGRIVESGTHFDLLAKEGAYAKLHALQFAEDRSSVPCEAVAVN